MFCKYYNTETSGQDGGIGRYPVPPCIARTAIKSNCMESNNQGVKEETFIQTGRRGGDGQLGREDSWQGGGSWSQWSHICMWINQEEQLSNQTDFATQGSSTGK